jgi:hypothetical protein
LASATILPAGVAFASTHVQYCMICEDDPEDPDFDPDCGLSPVNCTGSDLLRTYPLNAAYNISNHGGRTMSAAKLYNFFYGEKTYWTSTNTAIYATALTNLGNSQYLTPFLSSTGLVKPTFGDSSIKYRADNPYVSYQDDQLTIFRHQDILQHTLDNLNVNADPTYVDPNGIYLVIFSPITSDINNFRIDANTPYDSKTNGFCGYHSYYTTSPTYGSHKLVYGVTGTGGLNCKWNWNNPTYLLPNTGFIDVTLSVMIHELIEMMSNPEFTAWYDNGPIYQLEYADKCQGFPSGVSYITGTSGKVYNAVIGSTKFLLQAMFNKTANSCPASIYV